MRAKKDLSAAAECLVRAKKDLSAAAEFLARAKKDLAAAAECLARAKKDLAAAAADRLARAKEGGLPPAAEDLSAARLEVQRRAVLARTTPSRQDCWQSDSDRVAGHISPARNRRFD